MSCLDVFLKKTSKHNVYDILVEIELVNLKLRINDFRLSAKLVSIFLCL